MKKQKKPSLAPGTDQLEEKATPEEIAKGNTPVSPNWCTTKPNRVRNNRPVFTSGGLRGNPMTHLLIFAGPPRSFFLFSLASNPCPLGS
jgi:hypothetical protein